MQLLLRAPSENLEMFASEISRLSLSKLNNVDFARTIITSILMYFRETMSVFSDHILHLSILVGAKVAFPCETDICIFKILMTWGDQIRSKCVMDNLLQMKSSIALKNLSEECISKRFVGAHTFQDILNKLVAGYRGLTDEILVLKRHVSFV